MQLIRRKIKKMAVIGIIVATLTSCGGGASDLFGDLPNIYLQNGLHERRSGRVELDPDIEEKIIQESEAISGRKIDITDDEIKVIEPFSFSYCGMYMGCPMFNLSGKAEAATDLVRDITIYGTKFYVKLAGFNSAGKNLFEYTIGTIKGEYKDDKVVIKAGTPVKIKGKFDAGYRFLSGLAEDYLNTKELKIIIHE